MLKGMKFPIRVTPSGCAEMIEGSSVVTQNIILSVLPSGNLHPWKQRLAPEEEIIFEISDNKVGGLIVRHIRDVFDKLEYRGYARLLPGNRGISYRSIKNEAYIFIRFINLENDKTETIRVPVK